MKSDLWNPVLRHNYFAAWFTGNALFCGGALLLAANLGIGFVVAVTGLASHIVGFTLLWRAGRTTPWRSLPQWRDLPFPAARRLDPNSRWSRWAVVDIAIVVIMLIAILAQ